MENGYLVQTQVVILVQALGEWLLWPMKFFSFLGSHDFFLLVLPILYWCIDSGLGLRIGLVLLTSLGTNEALKLAFHAPRPYWYSAGVKALGAETSFGVPSGHSQHTASVWGLLAARLQKRWLWAGAILVVLLVGVSRLYLGLHFPQDVLLGWGLGALLAWAFTRFWEPVGAWLERRSVPVQVLLAFGASLVIVLIGLLPFLGLQGWSLPAAWAANAARAGEPAPVPVSLEGVMVSAGTLFGLSAGLAWIRPRGGYQAAGPLDKRFYRLLAGLLGVLLLRYGLGAVFPAGETWLAYGFRYLRYALIGAWVSAGAPWLFVRLKLYETGRR